MPTHAPYDEVADWYEHEFLAFQRSFNDDGYNDRLGIDRALIEMLGPGEGICLEVGCGTGIYGERVADLGRKPVGIDLSSGMLSHVGERLPVAQADAHHLPFADDSIPTAITVMAHTDMPDYPSVLAEIHRVLEPGGTFVHIGVHPCFCGGFADRTVPEAIVIKPGYLDGHWTKDSWTDRGIRDKLGASHFPLAELLNTLISTGFRFEEFGEGDGPTPVVLSVRSTKLS